jgi:hypothetical protein
MATISSNPFGLICFGRLLRIKPALACLAKSKGQRFLFQWFGLSELELLHDIARFASSKLKIGDIMHAKQAMLFALRRLFVGLSGLNSKKWGNRYVDASPPNTHWPT